MGLQALLINNLRQLCIFIYLSCNFEGFSSPFFSLWIHGHQPQRLSCPPVPRQLAFHLLWSGKADTTFVCRLLALNMGTAGLPVDGVHPLLGDVTPDCVENGHWSSDLGRVTLTVCAFSVFPESLLGKVTIRIKLLYLLGELCCSLPNL